MFQPEDDLNQDLSRNKPNDTNDNLDNIDSDISAESVALRKQQLEGVFKKLIIFGLALGTVLGVTAYYLLHKFGMTKKPYELKQERIERESERESTTPSREINDFSLPDRNINRFEI